MILLDNVLKAQLLKPGNKKKKVANRESIIVKFSHMTNAGAAGPTVTRLKRAVIP
jgi:hypothetical protein